MIPRYLVVLWIQNIHKVFIPLIWQTYLFFKKINSWELRNSICHLWSLATPCQTGFYFTSNFPQKTFLSRIWGELILWTAWTPVEFKRNSRGSICSSNFSVNFHDSNGIPLEFHQNGGKSFQWVIKYSWISEILLL